MSLILQDTARTCTTHTFLKINIIPRYRIIYRDMSDSIVGNFRAMRLSIDILKIVSLYEAQ